MGGTNSRIEIREKIIERIEYKIPPEIELKLKEL